MCVLVFMFRKKTNPSVSVCVWMWVDVLGQTFCVEQKGICMGLCMC